MSNQPITPTPEQLARAEALLNDGAPYMEVAETVGLYRGKIAAYFPGRGWSSEEAGQFSRDTKRMKQQLGLVTDRKGKLK